MEHFYLIANSQKEGTRQAAADIAAKAGAGEGAGAGGIRQNGRNVAPSQVPEDTECVWILEETALSSRRPGDFVD